MALRNAPYTIALWVLGCMGLPADDLWDESNLRRCPVKERYCVNRSPMLLGCTYSGGQICAHRCPLGRPVMQRKSTEGRQCASKCQRGYFVRPYENLEACQRHTLSCPKGQSVIRPGTAWHDTICGHPELYKVAGLLDREGLQSSSLRSTIMRLTEIWVRDIPSHELKGLCRKMVIEEIVPSCTASFETLLPDMPGGFPVESLYTALNMLSFYSTSKKLYDTVVKPFVFGDEEPDVSIRHLAPDPWWVDDQHTLIVQTTVTVPKGTVHSRYIPVALTWHTGTVRPRRVVHADAWSVASSESRYSIAKGVNWATPTSQGFFVSVLDISLVVTNFRCGMFNSVHVNVSVYDKHKGGRMLQLNKTLDFSCVWKPRPHPNCDCTRALLDYANPDGLCHPTCILSPFAHVSSGLPGFDQWELQITRDDPDRSIVTQGRALYGSVQPRTELFCVVTCQVFERSPGPDRLAPTAPLDVRRCDVVLLEFEIWTGEPPQGSGDQYLPIAVRSLNGYGVNDAPPKIHVPVAAKDTLRDIVRQAWGGAIGVKVRFVHSSRVAPHQEEIAAALDWILTFQSHTNRALRVVVIDVDLWTLKSSDFAKVNTLYRAKLDLIPGLSANALAEVIREEAETVLQELGLIVSSHGAFLNLDDIAEFQGVGGEVKPGRWSLGEYLPEDPYAVKIPSSERHKESSGLFLFEELCSRSNNRGGIVVSVPSADYAVPRDRGKRMHMVNRHIKPDTGGLAEDRVHYSMTNLSKIFSDMAKWGVGRYSLGYLDYTFGDLDGSPTFTELAHMINSAAAGIRTLRYLYTRKSTLGDAGYSYARVNGLYKLEGGMFFQRASDGTPLTKGFFPVPGVPNLRLGLSSDMNVGAPLPVRELSPLAAIEKVEFIPRDAHVIDLNYKKMVAFVDRGQIYTHSRSTVVRSRGLRLPSFGVRPEEETTLNVCHSYIGGAEHRARVSVRLQTASDEVSVLQESIQESSWFGTPVLTTEEGDWLFGKAETANRIARPDRRGSELSASLAMHLTSKIVECITGSSSCMELGDYADNGWPKGGTGYPIAISIVLGSQPDDVLVRMIISVNHGAVRVTIPCDLKPFSFGSDRTSSPQPHPGYMQTDNPLIAKVKTYVTDMGPITAWIVQPTALLYCPAMNRSHAKHLPSSGAYVQETHGCLTAMDTCLVALKDVFSQLGSVLDRNKDNAQQTVNLVAYTETRTSALSLSAAALAVLINITSVAMLCFVCTCKRHTERRFRKLQ